MAENQRAIASSTGLPGSVTVAVAFPDGSRREASLPHVSGGLYKDSGGELPEVVVLVRVSGDGGARSFEITWKSPQAFRVERVVLPGMLKAGPGERLLVPNRMGELLSPGEPVKKRLRTGNRGLAMFFAAAVGESGARLCHWQSPAWELWLDGDGRSINVSLAALEPGVSVVFESLATGDLAAVFERAREVFRRSGWIKPWAQKAAEEPRRRLLEGAAELRALCFSRFVPGCWFNDANEDVLVVDYTFDDVAAIAEHWRQRLGIDRALFMVCGWMRRGYDNQHPDVLPAAAECGGDEALRRASEKVQSLGYLFGLHDNYHDMYPDAPSWNPAALRKGPAGEITLGGKWAGGQAALLCAQGAIPYLERNLPEIIKRYNPNAFYIDVIYAHPLEPCFDPDHPLDREGDLKARSRQVAIAKERVPVFGSEEGQVWGAADADYFEGLLSHYLEKGPAEAFPWFEWVLGDCVHLYTWAWDQATPDRSDYIVRALSLRRMPIYAVPSGRYFERSQGEWRLPILHRHYAPQHVRRPDLRLPPLDDESAPLARGDQGWSDGLNVFDRFIKNTYEVLSPVSRALAGERMTGFRRFGPNGLAVETRFGPAGRIVVSEEPEPVAVDGAVLPRYGFVARTEHFLALHVLEWEGVTYPRPVLFTIASADGRPLEVCTRARIFHGFGEPRLSWRGKVWRVEREDIIMTS